MFSTNFDVQLLDKAKEDMGGTTNMFLGCRMRIRSKEAGLY
jgi:hypothetical protein